MQNEETEAPRHVSVQANYSYERMAELHVCAFHPLSNAAASLETCRKGVFKVLGGSTFSSVVDYFPSENKALDSVPSTQKIKIKKK